jgi:hypothetical protein
MEIHLANSDFVALIDDADLPLIADFRWFAKQSAAARTIYVHAQMNGNWVLMHRFLFGITDPSVEVDHFNGDGLDNRRSTNLRLVTSAQQSQNRRLNKNNKSGARGVDWVPARQCWRAHVRLNGKYVFQKRYANFQDAVLAASAARERFFTHTNESRTNL